MNSLFSRTHPGELLLTFGVLFLLYGLIISQSWSKPWLTRWLWVSIAIRLLLLFTPPGLSDDYARFVWDGRLLAGGYNPYLYLPTDLVDQPWASQLGLTQNLYKLLNSPHYFTVYPPLNQAMFGVAAWFSDDNLNLNILILRGFIIIAECLTILYFLPALSSNRVGRSSRFTPALVYGLNPLVIVELTGNLHFEAVTLCLTLSSVWYLQQKKTVVSASLLAIAAGVKLLPLIFLPLFVYHLGWRRGIRYAIVVGIVTSLIWLPFLSLELIGNIWNSLDLYFQKFEFNASFYYLFRTVGYWFTGYNIIQTLGPVLSTITVVGIGWILTRRGSLSYKMLWIMTLYFLLATTVHPWYIMPLVALGALASRWYPVVWSVLLPLTYLAYSTDPYKENLGLVALEYVFVGAVIVYEEIWANRYSN